MKEMMCAQMGGPSTCTAVIKGDTAEHMVRSGTRHVEKAHPEMAADMKSMSKEDRDQWMSEFQQKWEAAAEV